LKVAISIIAKNEEERIIERVYQLQSAEVDRIFLFDDNSEDNTIKNFSKSMNTMSFIPYSVISLKNTEIFAEKRNEMDKCVFSSGFDYNLHIDVDEVFDSHLLSNIKEIIVNRGRSLSFTFPRINLPNGKNYPDYQTRLIKNDPDIIWKGKVHEKPYSKELSKPLVGIEKTNEEFYLYNQILRTYPILHLPRRRDIKREWW